MTVNSELIVRTQALLVEEKIGALSRVPLLIKSIIKEDKWHEGGRGGRDYSCFRAFVEDLLPNGLAFEWDRLKMICGHDQECISLMLSTIPELGDHGTNQFSLPIGAGEPHSKSTHNTDEDYIAKLKREAKTDATMAPILSDVLEGKITPIEGAIKAGYREASFKLTIRKSKTHREVLEQLENHFPGIS